MDPSERPPGPQAGGPGLPVTAVLGALMVSLALFDFVDLMAAPPAGPIIGHVLFDAVLALAGGVWLWRWRAQRGAGR